MAGSMAGLETHKVLAVSPIKRNWEVGVYVRLLGRRHFDFWCLDNDLACYGGGDETVGSVGVGGQLQFESLRTRRIRRGATQIVRKISGARHVDVTPKGIRWPDSRHFKFSSSLCELALGSSAAFKRPCSVVAISRRKQQKDLNT